MIVDHESDVKTWIEALGSNRTLEPNKDFIFSNIGLGVTWGYFVSFGVKIQTF